jgi:hypothetical protein
LNLRIKYPRTPHLTWSEGCSKNDVRLISTNCLKDKTIVASLKCDGEATTIYSDGYVHARSPIYTPHESRTWVKSLASKIAHLMTPGWRICGENMYARHTLKYDDLDSYFLVYAMFNDINQCCPWNIVEDECERLGLCTVPVLYTGKYSEKELLYTQEFVLDDEIDEGYVVRNYARFHYNEFALNVAKFRFKHFEDALNESDSHWIHRPVEKNVLRGGFNA